MNAGCEIEKVIIFIYSYRQILEVVAVNHLLMIDLVEY